MRSIPARAGEPICSDNRLCREAACGLSPRVRGNPVDETFTLTWRRSIPARAGEPYAHGQYECDAEVYPRACGGTSGTTPESAACPGLSPRVRGNRCRPAPHG